MLYMITLLHALKDGKVYYSNSNDKHISVYSDSDEVSGFDSLDTTGRVMRIKSFNLSSESIDADIFLILENGSVMGDHLIIIMG